MNDYLDKLKQINLRPPKVKVKEQEILLEQEPRGISDIQEEIIKWFMANPAPKDEEVHKLAESMGVEPDKFESYIYGILGQLVTEGRSKDFKGSYNPRELAMGIKVEKEHVSSPLIAEKIAKDHLAELPDYYTKLKEMESKGGVTENIITELFIQQGEIEAMDTGPERDMAILRLSMIAELDASNLYERMADLSADENVRKVLLDISGEEKVHAGEFETLLEEIDPDYEEKEEEGEKEVEDLTGISD